jgi:hypothetical protein
MVVSDLINQNASWNLPLLSSLFDSQSVKEIQKLAIKSSLGSDFLWVPSPFGKFSSSLAHRLISSQRVSSYSSPLEPKFWKQLWKLNLNAKLELLLWKIASDILPSKARLKKVFPMLMNTCFKYMHLFFMTCYGLAEIKLFMKASSLTLPN